MKDQLEQLKTKAIDELGSIAGLEELNAWRIRYLGKKGELTSVLRGLGKLPPEERREVGSAANELKVLLESSLEQKEETLKGAALETALEQTRIDVTLPGRPVSVGRLHPVTQMLREICGIFSSMGFQVVEGPDVEWDYYNFDALNIPKDHPARDMWDTMWIDPEDENNKDENKWRRLLRCHTSPMQIRVMEKTEPPIRVVVPGRTYRYEATDATHESMFYQVEGLAVDKDITMSDLKGTLFEFARRLFGKERKARFRCDFFPFVEPGVDMAIDCMACGGSGCRVCSYTGWLEIMGAGMVHPEVLRGVGYDPDVYTGFAFGIGVERMPMLRYGIDDIRHFYGNDLRFLRQF